MGKQRWGSREWIIDQHYKEKDQTEKEKKPFNIQASQTSFRRSSVKYLSTAVWSEITNESGIDRKIHRCAGTETRQVWHLLCNKRI